MLLLVARNVDRRLHLHISSIWLSLITIVIDIIRLHVSNFERCVHLVDPGQRCGVESILHEEADRHRHQTAGRQHQEECQEHAGVVLIRHDGLGGVASTTCNMIYLDIYRVEDS